MESKPVIYAVDFDGTLSFGSYPECGSPNMELIEFLKKERTKGNKVILLTSRGGPELDDAVLWCQNYGLTFDAVNDNLPEIKEAWQENPRKVFANYYFDDCNAIFANVPYHEFFQGG